MSGRNTFSPGNSAEYKDNIFLESLPTGSKIAVVGAGAFGGWTSLMLLRKGFEVTLIDQWGPGNSLSSSGGETRLIRCIYGTNPFYTIMANRAYTLWLENEPKLGGQFLFPSGCLWFVGHEADNVLDMALPILAHEGLEYERLEVDEINHRYPLVNTSGLQYAIHEKKTGYLMARAGCQAVKDLFIKEGGNYILNEVKSPQINSGKIAGVELSSGGLIEADQYIFACGPWLKSLFPGVLDASLTITRQEIFYFGIPSDKTREIEDLPTWIDHSPPNFYYGIPGGIQRGFKIAYDRRGIEVDPTTQDRLPNPDEIDKAKTYITHRFNGFGNPPLIEARVCQYSDTADGNFIFDRHPETNNLWLLGGGSGHGFKHGPAIGELITQILMGEKPMSTNLMLATD